MQQFDIGTVPGMTVYRNAVPVGIPGRLETLLDGQDTPPWCWQQAMVGEGTRMPEYRDCVDFKYGYSYLDHTPPQFSEAANIFNDVATSISNALKSYQNRWNISMNYMEAINFVRYNSPGGHFGVHSDHGFSYVCTVSCVAYLNDNYVGGELWFPYLDLTYEPVEGDVIFFPSTYIFAHASKPVIDGVKYAAVTMFDYNDSTHRFGGFPRDIYAESAGGVHV